MSKPEQPAPAEPRPYVTPITISRHFAKQLMAFLNRRMERDKWLREQRGLMMTLQIAMDLADANALATPRAESPQSVREHVTEHPSFPQASRQIICIALCTIMAICAGLLGKDVIPFTAAILVIMALGGER